MIETSAVIETCSSARSIISLIDPQASGHATNIDRSLQPCSNYYIVLEGHDHSSKCQCMINT